MHLAAYHFLNILDAYIWMGNKVLGVSGAPFHEVIAVSCRQHSVTSCNSTVLLYNPQTVSLFTYIIEPILNFGRIDKDPLLHETRLGMFKFDF